MILAQEQSILKGEDQFKQMAALVRQASREGRSIHEVEQGLWKMLLSAGHAMMEGFVAGAGTGDLGPTLEHQGRMLKRLEQTHPRRYVSIFGELTIDRHVYGTRETQKHELAPLDARLGLPDSEFSYVLQDWDQQLCVEGPYDEARSTVKKILGLGQSVRSLEQMNLEMSGQVDSFFEAQPPPPTEEQGSILVLTSDGKGIPIRKDEPVKTGRRKRGKRPIKSGWPAWGRSTPSSRLSAALMMWWTK